MTETDRHTMEDSSVSQGDDVEDETVDLVDSYSDEDDYEDDDYEWLDIRQHMLAVVVAVVATLFAFYYQRLALQATSVPKKQAGRALQAPSTLETYKHFHLIDYQRTANVSFCGTDSMPQSSAELATMDFHVDDSLVPVMALHFLADWQDDDDAYTTVLNSDAQAEIYNGHREIRCLTMLQENSPKKFVKGITFYFKTPTIESMYQNQAKQLEKPSFMKTATESNEVHLTFSGFAAKFVNMAATPVLLYWDGRGGDDKTKRLVGEIAPFEALATATRPGESFSVSPVYDHSHALKRWVVTIDEAIHYYEPTKPKLLTSAQEQLYKMQMLNKQFAEHYLIHSGRSWLSHFPRALPVHHMWKADYFGQQHDVESLVANAEGSDRKMKFTLSAASVSPRVFTVREFLSVAECDALIQMAIGNGLQASTVYSGDLANQKRDLTTRSSTNTWLARDTAALTDQIYRRAAHVFNIDESLLQSPIDDDVHAHEHSIAESLQVIRYKTGEEYAPHHDWVIPSQRQRHQPTRFATLLLYLNDDFEGGQTIFPRAVNAQNYDGVEIAPERGMAVLFYNVLPDGNLDDLSQHGSQPVTSGEKFAANLWLWEPVIN